LTASRELDDLERLVIAGRITGYTVEPDPTYLWAGAPVITYSMYEHGEASRRNLALAADELTAMGATVDLVRRLGTWRWATGVRRSTELAAICWFPREADVQVALGVLRSRYVAGGRRAVAGSWRVPDVRVSGAKPDHMIQANAHVMELGRGAAAVVIGLHAHPPLAGMSSQRLSVLPCWADYLKILPPPCVPPPWRGRWPARAGEGDRGGGP
jgi:hypothetical protein